MGWWSTTIMGGDTPLDCLGAYCGVLGVEFDYDDRVKHHFHNWALTREALETGLETGLDAVVAKIENGNGHDRNIGLQVLGAMVLWSGASIPDDLRERIIDAARSDEWAEEGDPDRIKHVNAFIACMQAHEPGKPVSLETTGLFGG